MHIIYLHLKLFMNIENNTIKQSIGAITLNFIPVGWKDTTNL